MTTTTTTFNDTALTAASAALKANDKWLILTHRKSDGDAVGSANALFEAGINIGKIVQWLTPDEKLPETYSFLPHFRDCRHCEELDFNDEGTLYIFLDCSTEKRTVEGYSLNSGINSLNIDHHEDNSLFAKINCVDGSASSTCEMLYRIFTADCWNITQQIAESLYTGIFTDTGGFSFSNTSPKTHSIAAELITLGVKPAHITNLISQNKTAADLLLWSRALSRVKVFGDKNIFAVSAIYADDFSELGADVTGTEGLPQMFMSLRGVMFAAVATEYPDGTIRLSIRSRDGSPLSAGKFARKLGGGGHNSAAGCELKCSRYEILSSLENEILNFSTDTTP